MKPFRERNPVPIGAVSLGLIAALIFTAFHAGDMTIFGGGGKKYHAELTDTDDLQTGDSVLVAGVSVGKVTGVDLDGGHVQITFQLHPGNTIGDESSASVRLKTLVGDRVLAVSSAGSKTLPAGGDIPLSRTSVPLSVQDALGGTSQEVDQINTGQLAQAFNVVSDDLKGAPAVTKQALTGLSRLSTTVADQDTNLQSLLTHAQAVTATLNSRDSALTEIVKDADLVLQVVQQRKAVIDALLQHSQDLATQVTSSCWRRSPGTSRTPWATVTGSTPTSRTSHRASTSLLCCRVFSARRSAPAGRPPASDRCSVSPPAPPPRRRRSDRPVPAPAGHRAALRLRAGARRRRRGVRQ
jgi:phospholipid/cholesterol/gamma-HCH transport system substrate-binding protein